MGGEESSPFGRSDIVRDSTEVITVGEERSLPNRGIGRRIQYVDIDKSYGSIAALKPTNLTIEPGEFFSIIGPSGSGKTTLLGLTAGFIIPSNGKILGSGLITSS